ncbi:MAG: crosslink repair DNA glycosylase YcaQ family protein [Thermoplasmata archaeon]
MTSAPIRISLRAARRLAVTKQHLSGTRPRRATAERIVETVRDLPYVQWDPVSVVAPSHLLSLWARVGSFRLSDFDRLLWSERRLLQHWIPFAGVVATEDYPLYASLMRRYPESLSDSWGAQRAGARAFLAKHGELRTRVLAELQGGPLQVNQFKDHARTKRTAGDWEPSSAVSEMLWHLLMSGQAMVVGHDGNQNLWGLPGTFLPSWVNREVLSEEEADLEAAQRALRGLGVATAKEVGYYFIRGCYRDIRSTVETLAADSRIHRVVIAGLRDRDERYVHADDVALLDELTGDRFSPRLAVLPPFDNMVCSPARGQRLFHFDYVREQFLPKAKRRFGMWVLPILRGEALIGRLDARLDKEKRRLQVHAIFAEPAAPTAKAVATEIREELDRLAAFLGADSVAFTSRVPPAWKGALR